MFNLSILLMMHSVSVAFVVASSVTAVGAGAVASLGVDWGLSDLFAEAGFWDSDVLKDCSWDSSVDSLLVIDSEVLSHGSWNLVDDGSCNLLLDVSWNSPVDGSWDFVNDGSLPLFLDLSWDLVDDGSCDVSGGGHWGSDDLLIG